MTILLITLLVGAGAGVIGALLGIGGGVLLVPFLNRGLGLSFAASIGVSLVTVVATSVASSAMRGRLKMVNLKMAMVLEVFTVGGAIAAIALFANRSDEMLRLPFAWTMIGISVIVLSRIDRRNVITDSNADIGWMGGRYVEAESGGEVAYRLRRTPVAFVTSFLAGVVSQFGIGGGVMVVPALNTWCGIPIRVAAATSAFMLGVTALVGATHAFIRGDVVPELAAAAVMGVLAGTQLGVRLGVNVKAKTQKVLMVAMLVTVWAIYFFDLKAHR